jgi:hypothetical protein
MSRQGDGCPCVTFLRAIEQRRQVPSQRKSGSGKPNGPAARLARVRRDAGLTQEGRRQHEGAQHRRRPVPRAPSNRGACGKLSKRGLAVGMGQREPTREPQRLFSPRLQILAGLGIRPPSIILHSGFSLFPDPRPQETDGGNCQWQDAKRQLCVRPPLSASVRSLFWSPAFRGGRPLLATQDGCDLSPSCVWRRYFFFFFLESASESSSLCYHRANLLVRQPSEVAIRRCSLGSSDRLGGLDCHVTPRLLSPTPS